MFKHGTDRTINVIISKGEDCGVIKESVDKLRNIVNNNEKATKDVIKAMAMAMLITGALVCINIKQLADLDKRVAELENSKTAEENQEN